MRAPFVKVLPRQVLRYVALEHTLLVINLFAAISTKWQTLKAMQ